MKKNQTRVLSFLLTILIVFSSIPFANASKENTKQTNSNASIAVAKNNALSNVLSDAFEGSQTEIADTQDDAYTISVIKSLEVNRLTATVQFSAPVGAELVVAIYEEDSMKMITSGNRKVAADETEVTLTLAECVLPDYYIVKAFLLDQNHNALCEAYVNREHTQWVQEFLAVSIDDFEPEQILFAENDENFAVISSEAVTIDSNENTNTVKTNDMNGGIYRFENADEQLKSLKSGDIFYVDLGDDYILDKVVSISVDKDGVVTIRTNPDESALDYFEYIRIDSTKLGDTSAQKKHAARNASSKEEDEETEDDYKDGGHSGKIPFSLKYSGRGPIPSDDKKTKDENVKEFQTTGLNANVTWSISVTGSYSVSVDYKYYYHSVLPNDYLFDVTVKNKLDVTIEGTVSGTFGCTVTFLELDILTAIPAVNLLGVVTFEFSASAKFSTTLTGNVTQEKKYHREVCKEKGIDIDEKKEVPSDPEIKISDKLEAVITLKLKGNFGLRILKVLDATVYISATIKATCALLEIDLPLIKDKTTETTVTMNVLNQLLHLSTDPKDKIKHDCNICLKIDCNLECELGVELSLRIFKRKASSQDNKNEHKLSGSVNPHITFNKPLGSWRLSFRPGLEIAKMKDKSVLCPHIRYLVLLELKDKATGNAPDMPVTINIKYDKAKETLKPFRLGADIPPLTSVTTDENGRASVFLPSATYSYAIDGEDYLLSGSADGTAKLKVDNTVVYEKAEIESTKPVTLTVNDPDGKPIEGAAVAFGGKTYHTGADGKTAFKAKMGAITVTVTSADGIRKTYTLDVKKEDNNFTVTLDIGHNVVITVVDGNDQPLAGASLACGKQGQTTDSSGKAVMKLSDGEQVIAVMTADGAQKSFTRTITPETKTLLLKLQQTYLVTGTVKDKETGALLSSVSVIATQENGGEVVSVSTGSDGKFQLKLTEGKYSIALSLSGYQTQTFDSTIRSDVNMGTIQLEKEEESPYQHIQFGTYPQSRVTDAATIAKLEAASKTWVSYGYYSGTGSWNDGKMTPGDFMRFADFKVGGVKYRAVKISEYRPYDTGYTHSASETDQDENGYTPGTYYFKYEPLSWRVLDASTGYVMCESLIDAQAYQNTVYYGYKNGEYYWQDSSQNTLANDYATSSLHAWLNYDFYETAFTDTQKANIRTTALNNDSPYYAKYNSAATNDKIFLLSYADATNSAYGFSSSASNYDPERRAKGTDYAQSQGLYVYRSSGSPYDQHSWWWLRSPGSGSSGACGVGCYGGPAGGGSDVCYTGAGVRPACRLSNLKSDISQSDNLFSQRKNSGAKPAPRKINSATSGAAELPGFFARNAASQTVSRADAVKAEEYVLLVVKNANAENLLAAGNLLYIDQQTAESATVTFTYVPRENVSGATATIYGPEKKGYRPGDVNDDGQVTAVDRMILSRYIAKWDGYDAKIVNWDAADINGDHDVTAADRMILSRFIAKWDGYDKYFAER